MGLAPPRPRAPAPPCIGEPQVYHYVEALLRHYSTWAEEQLSKHPRTAAHRAAVAARPRVAAYLASNRCPPWDEDSLM
jgi:glutathione S-transferase